MKRKVDHSLNRKSKQKNVVQPKIKTNSFASIKLTLKQGVRPSNNDRQITFSVPFGTPLKDVREMLMEEMTLENRPDVIGFETKQQDFLIDFKLEKGVGAIDKDLELTCFLQNKTLQNLSRYKLCKCLATGGFGKVYLSRSYADGKFYAAKFIDKNKVTTDEKKKLIMNEKQINQHINHPSLVKMQDFIETENFYAFVMDYCPGGELFYLLRFIKRVPEKEAKTYFIEVLQGIQYLHSLDIIYRDLKPENILLDEQGHVKIADFGLAKYLKGKSYSFCGSIQYMSPEVVQCNGHSFEVDFYCLGALLYELLIGCPPFYDPNLTQQETKMHILFDEVEYPSSITISEDAKDLLQRLLEKNPLKRMGHFGGAKQIMCHPWIGRINRKDYEERLVEPPFKPNLNIFNFDPEEIGLSEDRFTKKVQNQYRMHAYNERKKNQESKSKEKKEKGKHNSKTAQKYEMRRLSENSFKIKYRKSDSPYLKELSRQDQMATLSKHENTLTRKSLAAAACSPSKGRMKKEAFFKKTPYNHYKNQKLNTECSKGDEKRSPKSLLRLLTEQNFQLKQNPDKDKGKLKKRSNMGKNSSLKFRDINQFYKSIVLN